MIELLERVNLHDIYNPIDDTLICESGSELTEEISKKIVDGSELRRLKSDRKH